ncbi:MAG: CvpA family protein [Acidobacteria bacterium]|nr:CvpA family protein [Acidobacteriota bacterium]
MNWLDIVFLVILGLSFLLAALKGFVKELVTLVSLCLAVILAGRLYPALHPLTSRVASHPLDSVLGFLLVFFGVLGLGALLIFLIHRLLSEAELHPVDRVLGALFGLVRGWLVCAVIILALTAFPWKSTAVENSALAPYLMMAGQGVVWALPRDLRDGYDQRYRELYRLWVDRTPAPGPRTGAGSDPAPPPAGRLAAPPSPIPAAPGKSAEAGTSAEPAPHQADSQPTTLKPRPDQKKSPTNPALSKSPGKKPKPASASTAPAKRASKSPSRSPRPRPASPAPAGRP